MTKIIASMALATGFSMIPAVSTQASAYFHDNTQTLMSPIHDAILLARGGHAAGVSKSAATKQRIEADLNKRGVGAGTPKGVPPR